MHKSGNVLFKIFQMSKDNKGVIYEIACCVSHHHSLQINIYIIDYYYKIPHVVGGKHALDNTPRLHKRHNTRAPTACSVDTMRENHSTSLLRITCCKFTVLLESAELLPVIGNVEILQFFLELLKSSEEESK